MSRFTFGLIKALCVAITTTLMWTALLFGLHATFGVESEKLMVFAPYIGWGNAAFCAWVIWRSEDT